MTKCGSTKLNSFGQALDGIVSFTHGNKYEKELSKFRTSVSQISSGSPRQAEAGVRELGERLGFVATRPDNDINTGPDVLWINESSKQMIGFELKTDKEEPATYFKKDISQGHDHLQWMSNTYDEYKSFGIVYVGPIGNVDALANPSSQMGLCPVDQMVSLGKKLIALLEDLREETPLQRPLAIADISQNDEWEMEKIVNMLWQKQLAEDHV